MLLDLPVSLPGIVQASDLKQTGYSLALLLEKRESFLTFIGIRYNVCIH